MNQISFKRLLTLGLVVVSAFLLFNFVTNTSAEAYKLQKDRTLLSLIQQTIHEGHYEPRAIDDDFSEKAFELYLRRLDGQKRFFTQSDVEILKTHKRSLDDEFTALKFDFFDLSVSLMEDRINLVSEWIDDILKEPFDFDKEEWIELNPDNLEFAKDEEELKDRWRRVLKYQVLTRLYNSMENEDEDSDSDEPAKTYEELEKEAREGVKTSQKNLIRRLGQMERSDWQAMYINSLTGVFCPHTAYFPPEDKEDFDISMSGQLEGIGAQLQDRDGEIRVTNIVPGSASSRQGELEVGDVILKVGQGSEEPVEITGMRLDRAVRLIRGPKGTEVRLTVRKVDGGGQTVIPIIRDIVVLEESYARSFILEDPASKEKYGYIKLPSFYADFQGRGGRNSSDDIESAVKNLKSENMDGIILDLRNNGGGSLQDVVDIVGLFIESGPIVQVKSRMGPAQILADRSNELLFDGKLLVLVNQFSASASEILAAAIQDYERGVIVGSEGTFGKGTVQRFFNLDRFLSGNNRALAPLGSIKLTTQKFYRINGGATQLIGAVPDIILPDNFMLIETGESEHDYPLSWSEIDPVQYNKWKNPPHLDDLRASSTKRVQENELFGLIKDNAQRLHRQNEERRFPLKYDSYVEHRKAQKEESERFDAINKTELEINVLNLSVDKADIKDDESKKDRNESWIEEIVKDPYVFESFQIIKEMN
ncbi:MAG: tail-specific protease [Chitinophagaceae bacterium]|nr:MAG: tail-specific protease [Chitinophagaceae bacterium]